MVFTHHSFKNHESVNYFFDPETNLKTIIAIHDQTFGPALGGCRMYPYETEGEALNDVLRLSRGMTYKSIMANVPFGGGKAVIIGTPKTHKSPALMQKFGDCVNALNGRYITAEDVGTNVNDMQEVKKNTQHVVGLSAHDQGSDDPAPFTAYGIYVGILASVKYQLNLSSVSGLKVLVQGLGSVGYNLCKILHEKGAQLFICDINDDNIDRAKNEFGATPVYVQDLFKEAYDIFCPCAMGGGINHRTVINMKVSIIAGSANNQLETIADAQILSHKNILYAPDYVINAGGLINVSFEKDGYSKDKAFGHIESIYNTLDEIFKYAKSNNITTAKAADMIAEERYTLKRQDKRKLY
jgi:leucine dehydrogenase